MKTLASKETNRALPWFWQAAEVKLSPQSLKASPHQLKAQLTLFFAFNWQVALLLWPAQLFPLPAPLCNPPLPQRLLYILPEQSYHKIKLNTNGNPNFFDYGSPDKNTFKKYWPEKKKKIKLKWSPECRYSFSCHLSIHIYSLRFFNSLSITAFLSSAF